MKENKKKKVVIKEGTPVFSKEAMPEILQFINSANAKDIQEKQKPRKIKKREINKAMDKIAVDLSTLYEEAMKEDKEN